MNNPLWRVGRIREIVGVIGERLIDYSAGERSGRGGIP